MNKFCKKFNMIPLNKSIQMKNIILFLNFKFPKNNFDDFFKGQ